jgi:hypothetical protein
LKPREALRAFRNLIIELVLYAALVIVYAYTVIQFLVQPLAGFYAEDRTLYAVLALALIVGQGVFLEEVTTFLIDRLRLTRFE